MIDEIFLNFDFNKFIAINIIVLVIYLLIIKKIIYTWFDPLLIYAVFNATAITLVIYLYLTGEIKLFYFITFSSSCIGFLLGLRLGHVKNIRLSNSVTPAVFLNYAGALDIFLFFIVAILVFSNALLFTVKGTVPLLSSNPSDAKVLLYEGGWGIVRRFNFIFTTIGAAIIFIKLVNPVSTTSAAKKNYLYGGLFLILLVLISSGSKGAVLKLASIFFPAYLINKKLYNRKLNFKINDYLKVINKATLFIFGIAAAYMFTIVFLTVGENGQVMEALLVRIIAAGDTFFFFYTGDLDHYFVNSPFDFIAHILNPLLAMIRVEEYENPIGSYILYHAIDHPISSFGPNAQHPIEGLIYFGPYLAWFYSLCVGLFIGIVRTRWLSVILKSPNQLNMLIYVIVSSMVVTIATESALFSTQLLDIVFYGIPLFAVSLVVDYMINGNGAKGKRQQYGL